jgi:hypothetical protein
MLVAVELVVMELKAVDQVLMVEPAELVEVAQEAPQANKDNLELMVLVVAPVAVHMMEDHQVETVVLEDLEL